MTILPESVEVGKCYLSEDSRVQRVVKFLPDGGIPYAYRFLPAAQGRLWRTGRLDMKRFAETTLREVPCGQVPEGDR